jgi:hypothetical protein
MATYGYSTPYTGTRQPVLPPGYMEAATAPGRYLAQGISSIGANIGQALERYGQAKAESQYLEQRLESLSPYLQATLGNVQEGSPEARLVSSLEKYSGMSNAKKKALLADAEFFLQRKDQEAKNQIAGMLQGQQYQMNQLKLAEDQRRLMQEEAMRQAMGEIGNIPTQMPQFQPMPVQEAGGPVEMQPVQQLPAVQRTPEQIRSDAVNVFRQFGVATPQLEALDKALIAAGKLPQVSTEEVPGVGTVVSMGGERKLVEQKTPSFSDVAKQRALTISFPEYQGVAPTEKEASDFREQYSNVTESKKNIDRLIEIANMGPLEQQTPKIKAEAEQISRAVQGAMRLSIVGQGVVTDKDRALLESIVRNPTDIFSLKSSNISALNSLIDRAWYGLDTKAKSLGLNPIDSFQTKTSGTKPVMVYDPVTKSFK